MLSRLFSQVEQLIRSQIYHHRTNDYHFPFTSILGIFFLILVFAVIFIYHQGIESLDTDYQILAKQTKENEWIIVKTLIKENRDKAQLNADLLTEQIAEDLLRAYNNRMGDLRDDMGALDNHSELYSIIDKRLKGRYLNVKNDDNAISVACPKGIIYNRSLNEKTTNSIRSWNEEINSQFNPYLGKQAMRAILANRTPTLNREIFWEPYFIDSRKTPQDLFMRYDSLKPVFLEEGLYGLRGFNFIAISYITELGDIFGVDDVDILGRKQDNHKLIIIQEFNLVDLIYKEGYDTYFEQDTRNLMNFNSELKYRKAVLFVSLIFTLAMIIWIFISLDRYINHAIKRVKRSYLEFEDLDM
jgi:hypothetical protein